MHMRHAYSWVRLEVASEAVCIPALCNVIYLFVQDVIVLLVDTSADKRDVLRLTYHAGAMQHMMQVGDKSAMSDKPVPEQSL